MSELVKKETSKAKWKALLGIIAVLVIFYASQLIPFFVYSFFSGATTGKTTDQIYDWLDQSVVGQSTFQIISCVLVVILVLLFIKIIKIKRSEIGIKKPKVTDILLGIVMFLPYAITLLVVMAVISYLIPSFNIDQKQEIGFDSVTGAMQLIFAFLSLVVFTPIAEEILTRGLLFTSFKKILPVVLAAIATGAVFAAAHLPEGGDSGPIYVLAVDTLVLSLFLAYLRQETGNIWSCVTLHAVKNGLAFLALFVFVAK